MILHQYWILVYLNLNLNLKFAYRKGKLYLVFEFVDKTLLEILEERTTGLQSHLVKQYIF